MDIDELALMQARVAEARRMIAEATALGEDTSDVEGLVAELELLLTDLRAENGLQPVPRSGNVALPDGTTGSPAAPA